MRIVFGHQSVGQNILTGLRELADSGEPAPAVTGLGEANTTNTTDSIAAFRIGRNGDPRAKLAHFIEAARNKEALCAELVLFKFCYVDVDERTETADLFDHYRRTIDLVRRQRPGRIVGQVTVPLRTLAFGLVARLRHLLGRHHSQLRHNAARDHFNAMLRHEYGSSGFLFDLAAVESGDDALPFRVPGPHGPVSALRPEYSSDGGHLGAVGRRVVAREFIGYLERLRLRQRSGASDVAQRARA